LDSETVVADAIEFVPEHDYDVKEGIAPMKGYCGMLGSANGRDNANRTISGRLSSSLRSEDVEAAMPLTVRIRSPCRTSGRALEIMLSLAMLTMRRLMP